MDARGGKHGGSIKDKTKIMFAAVTPGGAVTYLHDRRTLVRWEKAGLVRLVKSFETFDKYEATEKGREAWAKALPLP